jgi:hypothetical protein
MHAKMLLAESLLLAVSPASNITFVNQDGFLTALTTQATPLFSPMLSLRFVTAMLPWAHFRDGKIAESEICIRFETI